MGRNDEARRRSRDDTRRRARLAAAAPRGADPGGGRPDLPERRGAGPRARRDGAEGDDPVLAVRARTGRRTVRGVRPGGRGHGRLGDRLLSYVWRLTHTPPGPVYELPSPQVPIVLPADVIATSP